MEFTGDGVLLTTMSEGVEGFFGFVEYSAPGGFRRTGVLDYAVEDAVEVVDA